MEGTFPQLDRLRGVATLIVALHYGAIVFDHGLHRGLPQDRPLPWDAALVAKPFLPLTAGDFAVPLSFVLRGFVPAQSFLHSPLSADQDS